MPITITVPQPAGVASPGFTVSWVSDFVGPLPTGTHITFEMHDPPSGEVAIYSGRVDTENPFGSFPLYLRGTTASIAISGQPKDGDAVRFVVHLIDDQSNVLDQGTLDTTWSTTAGLGMQAFVQQPTTGGGLTPEQGQLLQETHDSSFPSQLVDALTLLPLTTGPTGDFIGAQLPNPTFGVIVRIANVPPELIPNTPDGDYWVPSLAVVRIFRGADLWKRVPIHTSSKLVELLDESIVAGITAITATQWLLNMTVQVTFRDGVTGEVFLLKVP